MVDGLDNFHEEQEPQEDLLDLDEVMQAFGVSSWKNLGSLEATQPQSWNLLVEIDSQRYILRERPEGLIGEDLDHRYAFQRYLQQAGIPIPPLWQTPEGASAVLLGEDAFELQQWPGGEQFTSSSPLSMNWTASAGSLLGRLHQASSRYRGHEHRWPAEAHIGAMVQAHLNLARARAGQSEIQAIAAALENWVDQWEAVLPSAMISIGAMRGLPEFHIHGDYHAQNLRFNTFGVTAVMGLEASRWEKRIFEVATGLFSFSALAWQPEDSLARPLVKRGFEPGRAREFLHAYGEIYPPMRGEANLLTDALMLISPIATINGPLEDLFYTQENLDTALIDDVMERLSWATSLPAWYARIRHTLAEMWG